MRKKSARNDRKSAPLKGEMLSKFPKMVPDIPYIWMAEVVRRITGSAKKETHICYKICILERGKCCQIFKKWLPASVLD